jgi:hypothetical protein
MRLCALTVLLLAAALPGCERAADSTAVAPPQDAAPAARPAPRYPDGTVRFDSEPGQRGYWGKASVSSLVEKGVEVAMDEKGLLANLGDAPRVAPFQPWALALYEYRQGNGLKDDPVRACIAPSGPRHLHTDGGFRIIRDPSYDRIYMLFGGGNRNWRIVFMDGREPPNPEEVSGTYFGHQSGRWEGDTLVVVSSGFNARFWFSNGGLPHTEALRLTERFSRPDFDTLKYEVTVDDPFTYTRPWTAEWTVEWVDGEEIAEQFCEDHRDDLGLRKSESAGD